MSDSVTANHQATRPAPAPSPIEAITLGAKDAAHLREIATPPVETTVPPPEHKLCPVCQAAISQFVEGLLARSRLPTDAGEADAVRYRAMQTHNLEVVGLSFLTADPEAAARYALGTLHQHFVSAFQLLLGTRRAPPLPPPDAI